TFGQPPNADTLGVGRYSRTENDSVREGRVAQKYTGFQKFAFGFAVVCAVAAIGKLSSSDKASESGASNPHRDAEMTEIKLQRLARELVTANLKDPDSAKFRNQKGVCGEVNAKNSFGGYAGFVRFIA